ncbi:MAG: metallophosphoesterase [Thermoplasmata archaeon]
MVQNENTILIFSDIHADIAALSTIFKCITSKEFEDRFNPVKKVINLGDVVGRGYSPGEVIEFIENLDYDVVSIIGNHDESVIYDWPISGDDFFASKIHDEFKQKKEHWDYFKDLKDFCIDSEINLLCIHGGPIDPISITPSGLSDYERWFYKRTWQRIDPGKSYFNPYTGFRYTPEMAFEHAKNTLAKEIEEEVDNILIFAGHQHREAVYQKEGGEIRNIHALIKFNVNTITCSYRALNFSEFVVEKDSSYLVRFGIAGPVGYGFYTSQFGVLYFDGDTKETKIALLEVDYTKMAQEVLEGLRENYMSI